MSRCEERGTRKKLRMEGYGSGGERHTGVVWYGMVEGKKKREMFCAIMVERDGGGDGGRRWKFVLAWCGVVMMKTQRRKRSDLP
jgi:hypothetical protein